MNTTHISVIIELRLRLGSANAFIRFSDNLIPSSFSVNLKENRIQILNDDLNFIFKCPENYTLQENTIFGLHYEKCFMYFRFNIKSNVNFGSFKAELITLSEQLGTTNFRIFLQKEIPYKICCAYCANILKEQIKFQRILPLPAENINLGDLFCHNRGQTDKIGLLMSPNLYDIFYTSEYCHLNKHSINNCSVSNKIISCDNCNSCLGTEIENAHLKLWFHNLKFFVNDTVIYEATPLKAVVDIVKNQLIDNQMGVSKILLSSKNTSSEKMLLLWVIEKELEMLQGTNMTDMKRLKVCKLLYRSETDTNSKNSVSWKKDANVTFINISEIGRAHV